MKRKVLASVLTMGMVASLCACGSSSEESTANTTTQNVTTQESAQPEATQQDAAANAESTVEEAQASDTKVSGSISMAGSTSMKKMVNAVNEGFMNLYNETTVTAEFTGSGAGIESVTNKSVDIGNSSRSLKDEEKEAGVVENVVAIDGIAVITDNANTVTGLSTDELVSIYTGEITNWSEVGGEDEPIVVIGRESGSGTRDGFESILGISDACVYANELDSTGAVIAKVAATPGAIGYASLGDVDDTVLTMSLDDVDATVENIQAGSYSLSRPFVMATNGEISEQSEVVQAYFDYLQSEEGQAIIESAGLINVK